MTRRRIKQGHTRWRLDVICGHGGRADLVYVYEWHQKPIEMNGVRFFGPDQRLVVMGSLDHKFDRVDMMPSLSERPARSLLDVFTPRAPDAEEIIVDPPTVASLLEQIRSLQEPELAEIRKRNRAREYRQGDQREIVRAQILTFAA